MGNNIDYKQNYERLEQLLFNVGEYLYEFDNEFRDAKHSQMCFGMTKEEHSKFILGKSSTSLIQKNNHTHDTLQNSSEQAISIAPFGVYDRNKSNSKWGGLDIFTSCAISKYEEKFIDTYKPRYYTYYFSTEEKCYEFYRKINELYDIYHDTKRVEEELDMWCRLKKYQ